MSDETRAAVEENVFGIYDGTKYNNDSDEMPEMGADNGLQLADLTGKDYDDADWDKLLDQLSFEDMTTLINVGGWQTAEIKSVGKIATSDCDGPAGLNNFITKAFGKQRDKILGKTDEDLRCKERHTNIDYYVCMPFFIVSPKLNCSQFSGINCSISENISLSQISHLFKCSKTPHYL